MDNIAERLEHIEARIAISELRSKYCWHTTRGAIAEVVELFAEDCLFENHRSSDKAPVLIRGKEALRSHLGRMAPGRRVPMVTNEVITVTGDRAIGTCVMQSVGADPFCGHYIDGFVRAGGMWKFAARRFFPYWPIFQPDSERKDP